jgi:ArsR family transcriptional regulator, arsenate/arsenite/antimonite-responsive transcriptional repressor
MHDVEKIRYLFTQSLPLFNALGDPIRQQLILLMMDGTRKSVAELAAQTELSRPTISHHLKILKDAHIIASQKVGTKIYYCPQMGAYFEPVKELVNTIVALEDGKGNKK